MERVVASPCTVEYPVPHGRDALHTSSGPWRMVVEYWTVWQLEVMGTHPVRKHSWLCLDNIKGLLANRGSTAH